MVPFLPYAAGCFLASILLTLAGIAETHPKALSLATYLIQFGWLLLQIQGAQLVQRIGTHRQCKILFNIWLISMQLLDVHRRFFKVFTLAGIAPIGMAPFKAAAASAAAAATVSVTSVSSASEALITAIYPKLITSPMTTLLDSREGMGMAYDCLQSRGGGTALTTVRAYYMAMLCSVWPTTCRLASTSTVCNVMEATESFTNESPLLTTAAVSTSMGMHEMECLVLFEIAGGMGVCLAMCFAWLVMASWEDKAKVETWSRIQVGRVQTAKWQRECKTIKGYAHKWRALVETKVEAAVEGFKLGIK
ncbi:hypothetical protein EDD11_000471 [Mortierella claussenii]|nr:hypothetical protein EDD11_000471 [Mortierella claussenii]